MFFLSLESIEFLIPWWQHLYSTLFITEVLRWCIQLRNLLCNSIFIGGTSVVECVGRWVVLVVCSLPICIHRITMASWFRFLLHQMTGLSQDTSAVIICVLTIYSSRLQLSEWSFWETGLMHWTHTSVIWSWFIVCTFIPTSFKFHWLIESQIQSSQLAIARICMCDPQHSRNIWVLHICCPH